MNQNEQDQTPLAGMLGISGPILAALREKWITTAEQFISIASTEAGHLGLCNTLSCDENMLRALLDIVAMALPPEKVTRLRQPVSLHPMGMLMNKIDDKNNLMGAKKEDNNED